MVEAQNLFSRKEMLSLFFSKNNNKNDYQLFLVRTFFLFYTLPVTLFIIALLNKRHVIEGKSTGFLEDYLFFSFSIIIGPLLMIILNIVIRRYISFLKIMSIRIGNSSLLNDTSLINIYKTGDKNFRIIFLQILLGMIIFFSNISSILKRTDGWNSVNNTPEFVISVIWVALILSTIMPQILTKYLLVIWKQIRITKFFVNKNLLKIKPVAPDKCGGLKPLGDLAISYTYFVAPLVFVILAHYLTWHQWTLGLILGIIGFIPFSTFIFFYPLSIVHKAMYNAKNNTLENLGEIHSKINIKLMNKLDHTDDELERIKTNLELYDNLYFKAEKMPVWPFNTRILTSFVTITFGPIIGVFTQLIINSIIK